MKWPFIVLDVSRLQRPTYVSVGLREGSSGKEEGRTLGGTAEEELGRGVDGKH